MVDFFIAIDKCDKSTQTDINAFSKNICKNAEVSTPMGVGIVQKIIDNKQLEVSLGWGLIYCNVINVEKVV